MAIKHLITWGIGLSPDAGDWPKFQVTHGLTISTQVIVFTRVELFRVRATHPQLMNLQESTADADDCAA